MVIYIPDQQQYESALDAFFEFKATGKVASSVRVESGISRTGIPVSVGSIRHAGDIYLRNPFPRFNPCRMLPRDLQIITKNLRLHFRAPNYIWIVLKSSRRRTLSSRLPSLRSSSGKQAKRLKRVISFFQISRSRRQHQAGCSRRWW